MSNETNEPAGDRQDPSEQYELDKSVEVELQPEPVTTPQSAPAGGDVPVYSGSPGVMVAPGAPETPAESTPAAVNDHPDNQVEDSSDAGDTQEDSSNES